MKKATKLICLLMALILSMSLLTGCSDKLSDDEKILDLTIGIPVSASDPSFADWQEHLLYWKDDYATFSNIDVTFVTVPNDEKGMKDFMRKVRNGKVAMFFSAPGDHIDQMIEEEAIIDYSGIRTLFATWMEETSGAVMNLSAADNLRNYMIPVYGNYQGLFINSAIFEENEIAEPTDWASLLAAIKALKAKGITPIAAGFKDVGLEYMVDEMILSEGGTAEHSYQPTFGVMSSWERAVNDIKTLEKAGAFTPDCYNVSFADAKQAFADGEAAMIVAPSAEIVPAMDADSLKAVSFPVTPTGKREKGAFIGDVTYGLYLSADYFYQTNTRYSEGVIGLLDEEYIYNPEVLKLLMGEDGFCAVDGYYDSNAVTTLDESYAELLSGGTAGDRPMRYTAHTMDTTVDAFRKALTGADVIAALKEASDAEIAAKAEAK